MEEYATFKRIGSHLKDKAVVGTHWEVTPGKFKFSDVISISEEGASLITRTHNYHRINDYNGIANLQAKVGVDGEVELFIVVDGNEDDPEDCFELCDVTFSRKAGKVTVEFWDNNSESNPVTMNVEIIS